MDPVVVILWFLWDSLVLQDTLSKRFSNKGAVSVRNSFYLFDSQACISIIGNCYIVIHPTACMFAIIRQQMALRFHMLSSEFLALLLYKSWSAADGFVDSSCEIMYFPYPMRNCYSQIIPLIHSWKVKNGTNKWWFVKDLSFWTTHLELIDRPDLWRRRRSKLRQRRGHLFGTFFRSDLSLVTRRFKGFPMESWTKICAKFGMCEGLSVPSKGSYSPHIHLSTIATRPSKVLAWVPICFQSFRARETWFIWPTKGWKIVMKNPKACSLGTPGTVTALVLCPLVLHTSNRLDLRKKETSPMGGTVFFLENPESAREQGPEKTRHPQTCSVLESYVELNEVGGAWRKCDHSNQRK